ncbi:class I SAM-dependent methyltransferase [Alkalihalobacillus pseudalcaliphilus]|uniref:class I SAM-dependent methyltransferase n=1 Tax=Alkalihalobacillus pseudalcaliphilus TaxID=79884 RepID=UPI00064DE625|nr:class I SAM-dependent methyltransferase [Alkalihalobacillus pseudalcaliphilus]KMK77298.1 hypothetical protein AB990_07050 [Alkalihalobacillus pseudalcaliphilus]
MIVTTVRKRAQDLEPKAIQLANDLNFIYVKRQGHSVESLMKQEKQDIIVVGIDKIEYFPSSLQSSFFYHPNSAFVRIKQIENNQTEPLKEVTKLQQGMSFLDCTMGLGADSLVAQYLVGESGKVVGLEENKVIATLVRVGMQSWDDGRSDLLELMKRIQVIHGHHLDYLSRLPENSVDVVYFDPMFEQAILNSKGIAGIRSLAHYETISPEAIALAKKVAKHRVVLKDHWQSSRFEQFEFNVQKRKHAAFHYGYLKS